MKRPTYSDIAKKLSKKKAKFEALSDSFDPAKKFTAERMVPKYESKLDELFQVQEMSKSPEGTSYLKNGGKLKYQDGGRPKFHEGWEDALSFKPRNFDNWGLDQGVSRKLQQDPYNEYASTDFSKGWEDALQFSPRQFDNWGLDNGVSNRLKQAPPADNSYRFTGKPYDEMGLRGRGPFDIVNQENIPESSYKFKPKPYNEWEDILRGKNKPSRTLSSIPFSNPAPSPSRAGVINQNRRPVAQTPRSGGSPGGTFKDANVNNLPFLDQLASMGMPQEDNVADPLAFLKDLGNMGLPQEDVAGTAPAQTGRRGFKGADIAGAIGPFMDNFANLINPTPNIPSPRFMSPARMETRFNVAPQINEMRRGMRNFGQSIDRSVGQAGQGAAFKGKALADYFKQTGNILGQKENIEQGLRNQQAQEIARTDNMNQQIGSQFDQMQLGRQESERMRRIGMLTNLGEDFMTMDTDRRLREVDDQRTAMLKETFNDLATKDPGFKALFEMLEKRKTKPDDKKYGGRLRRKMKKR